MNDAREEVAAELVGSEQEQRSVPRRAKQVKIGADEPEQQIGRVAAQETNSLGSRLVARVIAGEGRGIETEALRIDERALELALVEKMYSLWRSVEVIGAPFGRRVGSDHLGEGNREIGDQQDDRGDHRRLVAL